MYKGERCPAPSRTENTRFTDGITNGALWYPVNGKTTIVAGNYTESLNQDST